MSKEVLALKAELSQREVELRNALAALERQKLVTADLAHRTKNNLQLIASLIELKSLDVTDAKAQERLREIKDRVATLGMVFHLLYPAEEDATAHVIEELCELLRSSYGADHVAFDLDLASSITPAKAVPLSLLVTELLSNSFKHAFHGTPSPVISVRLHDQPDGRVRLVVADNGAGIPPEALATSRSVSGLRLVHAFAAELGGEAIFESSPGFGATVTVTFQA